MEFALHMAGAQAHSTQICWDEATRTLSVHAPVQGTDTPTEERQDNQAWYVEIAVPNQVDGSRAKGFLNDGTLRIVAPRVDSTPLSGLPLLAWAEARNAWSLPTTT